MKNFQTRRIISSLQVLLVAALIGMAMYVYNDYHTHLTHAAPLTPSADEPKSQNPYPLDQGVNGTVQVNPDGSVHQR